MKLEKQDMDKVVVIVAARYFSQQGWKWVDVRNETSAIYKAYDELKEQYDKYPYMSRDWYVSNSATRNIHMCEKWDELAELMGFLRDYGQYFDFLVKNERKSFCIASTDGILDSEEKNAVAAARKLRYNVFVFRVDVPQDIGFELMQIGGGL
jgi:flavoprotein